MPTHTPSSIAHTLTLADLRAVLERIEGATEALHQAFMADNPDESEVRQALRDGAAFEKVFQPKPGQTLWNEEHKRADLWQIAIDAQRLDLFEALLDADAVRSQPDINTPHLIARTAAYAPPAFLEALLAREPDLNQLEATPFLPYDQCSTCLVGPLKTGNDLALDRLLAAGADPRLAPQPPAYPDTGKEFRLAPRSMLHMVETAHAAKRLLAAGLDPEVLDEYGRNAVELVFDSMENQNRRLKNRDRWPQQRQRLHDTVLALLDGGVPAVFVDKDNAVRGTALTRAANYRFPDLVAALCERGMAWPSEIIPKEPWQAVHALADGVPLPLEELGPKWLCAWVRREAGWHLEEQKNGLATLARHGLPLTKADPDTGLTPLLAALQAGNYPSLIALIEAGMSLREQPGADWGPRTSWAQVLSKTISKAMGGLGGPGQHWQRVDVSRLSQRKKERLTSALKELGHRPCVVATARAATLSSHLAPAARTARARL